MCKFISLVSNYITNLLKFMRAGGLVLAPVSFVKADERFVGKVVIVTGGDWNWI